MSAGRGASTADAWIGPLPQPAPDEPGPLPRATGAALIGLCYAVGAVAVGFAVLSGDMDRYLGLMLAIGLMATPLFTALALRSPWARRSADPALRMPLTLVAITWTVVLYATTGRLHALQLAVLVLVITIAVCYLQRRMAALACAYAFVTLGATMFALARWQPEVYVPKVQAFYGLMMAADLPAVLLIGLQLFRLRARMKARRVELECGVARLRELATRDELTGLPNRHFVAETFEHLASDSTNSGESCAVVLIDLDHFKQVNDTYGHAAGDQALRTFARQASEQLRQVDVLSRWGGEEFLLVCPKTTAEGARISTARLRQALEMIQVLSEAPAFRIRFSAGITEIAAAESLEATLARSDIALYEAKEAGRNRSEVRLASTA